MEQEILKNTKMLLGLDESDAQTDDLLLFLIRDTADAIMKYCRIDIISRQLYGIIAQIVSDLYSSQSKGERDLKSVTEGERRVEFESRKSSGAVFEAYALRLEPFVNKSARLPSDMEVCDEKG